MKIDISEFFINEEPALYSASKAELGEDAGKITWNAALDAPTLLTKAKQIAAWRRYVKGSGAWSKDEIASWDDQHCNALFVQYVSGDIREAESLCTNSRNKMNWAKYERLSETGVISGNLFKGTDGHIYFLIGG